MTRAVVIAWVIVLLVSIPLVAGQAETAEAEPELPAQLPTEGELYAPLYFRVPVDADSYRNPFDTADIELIGIFEAPSGDRLVVPGFWMQPYECQDPCDDFDLRAESDPVWEVRFTPQETGLWNFTLQVRDNGAVVSVHDGQFRVADSDRAGFIRLGENRRYFEYTSGPSYFPIGHNLNWSWDAVGGLETYDRWLRELSEAGGNYARLIIDVPWFISLEWAGPAGDYRASQRAAAELDMILERAAEYGVHLQLVLLWHQALRTYTTPPVVLPEGVQRPDVSADWDDNPYNVLNGGVLSGPSVFFFNDEAQALFRRRLRYIVARWGYSPQVFAWEIIDQVDRTANYDPEIATNWLRSTASFIRQMDSHGHLITASSREYDLAIAENAQLDFAGAQFYQRRPIETVGDQVANVISLVRRYLDTGFAPVMLVDYSLNPWFEPTVDDPEGVHFQNTLWAAALSGASGGAMSDWWDTYVIPQGLQDYYAPLAAFTAGIDWAGLDLRPAQAGLVPAVTEGETVDLLPVRLSNFMRQFAARPQDVIARTITADGVIPDISDLPSFLYGQVFNTQFRHVQRYRVAPPVDTYLEVAIRSVSTQADAQLIVQVDNALAVQVNLRAGNQDVVVRVPLSAGEHTITLDNLGSDWLELDYIEIDYLVAPVRVLTLRDAEAGVALAWLQHRDYTWDQVAADAEREPTLFVYRLGMPPGRYVAEIWDPLSGAVLGEEVLRVHDDGMLTFELVPMNRQLALRFFRQPDEPAAATPDLVQTPTAPPTETAVPSATDTEAPTATVTVTATAVPEATPTTAPAESPDASPTVPRPSTPVRRASPLPTLPLFPVATNTPRP